MLPWPEKLHKWCCVPMVSDLEVDDVQLPLVGDIWSPVWSKCLIFFFFFYPLELTDLWGDILGLCKYPTVHQNFTLGLTCTGDWFLPEPIFSVVVIKMVVFQLAQLVWGYGLLVFSVVYNLLLASSFSHFIFIYFVFHGESPGSQHYQKHLIICSII